MATEITIKTREIHKIHLAKAAKIRQAHDLNDKAVTIRNGARAKSIYKDGSDYLCGAGLLVIAIQGTAAVLAGPHGPALCEVTDLVRIEEGGAS